MTRSASECSVGSNPGEQTKKRREARRNELRAEFLKQSARIMKKIDVAFGDPAKQVCPKPELRLCCLCVSDRRNRSQVVLAGLKELSDLLKRKAAIEEKIFAHTAILEKAYLDANQELSVSLKGRMQDIAQLEDIPVRSVSWSVVQSLIILFISKLSLQPLMTHKLHLLRSWAVKMDYASRGLLNIAIPSLLIG